MDDRNSCRPNGSLRHSFYVERVTLNAQSNPQERTRINACRHMLLVSHRNRQLGDAFPDVFFSLQWPGGFVLYGVCPWHSIGVPHQDRSAMYGLWASLSRCNPLGAPPSHYSKNKMVISWCTYPILLFYAFNRTASVWLTKFS